MYWCAVATRSEMLDVVESALAPPAAGPRRRRGDRCLGSAASVAARARRATRSPSACAPATPTSESAVLWTRLTGRTVPRRRRRRRRHVGARRRRVVHVGRRRPATSSPAPTRRTACTSSSTSPARRASASAPATGRARSAGSRPTPTDPTQLRLATTSCQHYETGYYAAHARLAEWAPDLVVFLGDFIYEYGAQTRRRRRRAQPRQCRDVHLDEYRAALRPVPLRPPAAGGAGGVPVAGDLGRPRGREQLRRGRRPRTPRRRRRSPPAGSPPTRRGGSTCRCASRGPPAPTTRSSIARSAGARSPTCCPARRPPVPLRPGVRRRRPVRRSGRAPRRRSGADDARRRAGAVAGRTARGDDGDVAGDRPADRAHRRHAAQRGRAQLRPVGRLPAGPPAPARSRPRQAPRAVVLTGDIHLAAVGRLPGVGIEFVTTSISSTGLVPADLADVARRRSPTSSTPSSPTAATPATRSPPETWTAEYRTVDDVDRRRTHRCRRGRRSSSTPRRRDAVTAI